MIRGALHPLRPNRAGARPELPLGSRVRAAVGRPPGRGGPVYAGLPAIQGSRAGVATPKPVALARVPHASHLECSFMISHVV